MFAMLYLSIHIKYLRNAFKYIKIAKHNNREVIMFIIQRPCPEAEKNMESEG